MTPDKTETTEFTDESIFCIDCGMEFIHTAAEKTFFAKMHYTNKPKRCVPCRKVRKESRGDGGVSPTTAPAAVDDERHEIVCSACGRTDRVPFHPNPAREVYCHACHLARVKGAREKAKRDGCPARK